MLGWLIIYGVVSLVASVVLLLFLRSVGSRKTYRCSQCGEMARAELMKATHCSSCGAPLAGTEIKHDQS